MLERLTGDLDPQRFASLVEVIDWVSRTHADLPAFTCLGQTLSYGELDRLSDRFADYLLKDSGLSPGDRIAIQLPNLLQFPVALYGALKAGLIVVNTNPLYTAREMRHQFRDSGVKAIVILANFCDKLQEVLPDTDIGRVIITRIGDLQNPLRRQVLNLGARYLKKLVPHYDLPGALDFHQLLRRQPTAPKPRPVTGTGKGDDVAMLLYTGGTTGYAKGVMLTHRNLIANMMQLRSRCLKIIKDRSDTIAAPLPLYHSYAFLFHCLVMPLAGNHNLLMPNPRDLPSVIASLRSMPVHGFVGLNTLFLAMMNHPLISTVDFSAMRFTGAGGMPLTRSVAEDWERLTGCEIFEGYGLTECSPVVSVNPVDRNKPGTVGPPVPDTEIRVVGDDGLDLDVNQKGELWVRGPQVMKGYWNRPEDTAMVLDAEGWFKTGDYAQIDEEGYIKIVDRKKDMILVSGFNVIPGEIEEYVNSHPGIMESAAIGIPSQQTGEAVVLYVVARDKSLTKEALLEYCREGLTAYKIPKVVVFADSLPKTNIGKVLRRELRDSYTRQATQ
ncbi:MAG: hypothetical protein RLZZ385_2244 [Pseudomonadota bacterium]|jgi:long-chain acyl-CoA synthetase